MPEIGSWATEKKGFKTIIGTETLHTNQIIGDIVIMVRGVIEFCAIMKLFNDYREGIKTTVVAVAPNTQL